jgi:hypothetical protein
MQEGGVDAAEGANALKSGLASLINPTKQATEMLSGMGINLQSIIEANKGDLMGTVRSFAEALGSLDQFSRQQALEQVFGKFQYAKLGALFDNISRKGSQAQQVIATMGYSTEQLGATADKELKTIEESFGVQLTGAIERFKLAIAPIGEIFVKIAIPLVNFATTIAEAFNGLSDGQKRFAAIGAVVIGVVVPAVTMLTGLFLNLVGTLAKMTQGVTLFTKGLVTGGPIRAFKALTQSSKYLSLSEIDAAMAAQQLAGSNEILNKTLVDQAIQGNAAAAAIGNLTKAYAAMISTQSAASGLPGFTVAGASGARAKASQMVIRGVQKRNSGGPIFMSDGKTVPGTGNTDRVPAMLTPGEFVVNKQATKNNLELLHSINDSKGPKGFNSGGIAKGMQHLSAGAFVKALRARNLLKAQEEAKNLADFVKIGMYSKEEILQNKATSNIVKGEFKKLMDGPRPPRQRSSQVQSAAGSVSSPREIAEAFNGSVLFEKLGISTGLLPSELNKLLSTNASGANAKDVLRFIELAGEDFLGPLRSAYSASNGPGRINTAEITENVIETLRLMGNEEKITDDIFREIIDSSIGNTNVREHVGRMRTDPAYSGLGRITGLSRNTAVRAARLGIEVPTNEKGKVTAGAARQALIETAERDISRNLGRQVKIFRTDERAGDKIIYEVRDANTSESLLRFKSGDTFSTESIPEHSGALRYTSFRGTEEQASIARKLEEALARKEISQEQFDLFTKGGFNLSHLNAGGSVVPGMGNKDTVPAMLTPGEFVVNKEATKNNLGLLHQINNSQKLNKGGMAGVQYFGVGGMVAGLAPMAAGLGASMLPMAMAPEMGMFGQIAASTAAFVVAQKSVQAVLMKFQKVSLKAVDSTGEVGEGFKKLFPQLSKLSPNILKFALPMASAGTILAAVGFTLYKLNKSLTNVEKSGAELSDAMYGSAKTTKAMADAFGRETNAAAAMRKAAERAGGQEISQEAVAASGEFMKSDAAKGILEDIKLVQNSGEDAVLALRNQLASSIIAGAITPEEAKAIALDIGKEIGSATFGIQVSGELTSLIGPNGERISNNLIEITGEITPKIDSEKIKKGAQDAFDSLNPGEKFVQFFKGGQESFVKEFSIDQISAANASALAKEAEARALLNLSYQEGTITLKEYLDQESKITSGANKRSSFIDNANAQALGFASTAAMESKLQEQLANLNVDTTGMSTLEASQAVALGEARAREDSKGKAAYEAIVTKSKESLKESFINSGMDADIAKTMTDSMEEGVAQIDPGIFDKFLSGQIPLEGYNILMNLESSGDLTLEDVERLGKELTALTTIPKIDKIINFETANEEMITEIYDAYIALKEEPEIFKGISIKDGAHLALDTMNQFGINYEWIMSLPDEEKIITLTIIENHVKLRQAAVSGDRSDRLALGASNAEMSKLREQTDLLTPSPVTDKTDKSGGGGNKFNELKKMLMERFKLQEMLIDKEAEGFNDRIKQLNREIELEERQVSLRQKGLEQLSKKEEAVNDAYNLRVEALDKVSESNSRIAEQEKSRIGLASALASGDIAAAATVAGEMQQQSAQYQIEDTKEALEQQRQKDLDSLTISINGKLMTRKGIESEIETIQNRMYDKGIEIQGLQDSLLKVEDRKLALAKEREQVETRMYLLQQRQAIQDLTKGKGGKLSKADKEALAEYKSSYNQVVDMYNASNPATKVKKVNYGGMMRKMAFGGVSYKGSTEAPPPIKMYAGSTVPGTGITDKVPALLTPGEFVVRKSVADSNRGFLEALNSQVFPGIGGRQNVPTNNFLDGIGSPRYSIPESSVTSVPTGSTSVAAPSSTMYNSTYNVNVNVSGTNASPDDIANVVMAKLSQQNRGSLRSTRY